jgi:hypothetical protein
VTIRGEAGESSFSARRAIPSDTDLVTSISACHLPMTQSGAELSSYPAGGRITTALYGASQLKERFAISGPGSPEMEKPLPSGFRLAVQK